MDGSGWLGGAFWQQDQQDRLRDGWGEGGRERAEEDIQISSELGGPSQEPVQVGSS